MTEKEFKAAVRKITKAQEQLCLFYAYPDERGRQRSQRTAFLLAYPNASPDSTYVTTEPSVLLKRPDIRAVYEYYRAQYMADLNREVSSQGIAVKAYRIQRKQKRHDRLEDLLEARQRAAGKIQAKIEDLEHRVKKTKDPTAKAALEETLLKAYAAQALIAGETTGLIVRDVKQVGVGENSSVVVGRFDKGPLDALLDLENSVAVELGQIVKREQVLGPDDNPVPGLDEGLAKAYGSPDDPAGAVAD